MRRVCSWKTYSKFSTCRTPWVGWLMHTHIHTHTHCTHTHTHTHTHCTHTRTHTNSLHAYTAYPSALRRKHTGCKRLSTTPFCRTFDSVYCHPFNEICHITPLHVATALSLLQVIDMEGFVLLNVRRTLLLLNRLFIRGEVAHRSSIHRRISLSIASTSNAKS